jgi:hypothetical protein
MGNIYQRRWYLSINGVRVINPSSDSLRCKFDVLHEFGDVITYSTFKIYNLAPSTVAQYFLRGNLLEFGAGYVDNIGQIFLGTITNVYDIREETDVITHVLCSASNKSREEHKITPVTFARNTPAAKIIRYVVKELGYGIDIKDEQFRFDATYLSNYTVFQDGFDALEDLSTSFSFKWAIVMGVIHIKKYDEFSKSILYEKAGDTPPLLVNKENGMEGRPEYTEVGFNIKVRLNPKFFIGGQIEVKSDFKTFKLGVMNLKEIPKTIGDGTYTVWRIQYNGDTHGDEWTSKLTGFTI